MLDHLSSLEAQITNLISTSSSKELINLEIKARNGDPKIIIELKKKIGYFQKDINDFLKFNAKKPITELIENLEKLLKMEANKKFTLKAKEKITLARRKMKNLSISALQIKHTINLLFFLLRTIDPITVDLSSSAKWIKKHHKFFPQTISAFVRPIDVLIQNNLMDVFKKKQKDNNIDLNLLNKAIYLLRTFGADLILGINSFALKEITPTFKIAVENLATLISEIPDYLKALDISSPAFIDLCAIVEEQLIGTLHLYPYLNQGIGKKLTLDLPALNFLQLSIRLNREIFYDFEESNKQLFSKLGKEPHHEFVRYYRSLCEFINRANTILDLPCTSEKEAKKLSLELYELVINHFPTFNTTFIEGIFNKNTLSQEVSDFINTIYAFLEFSKTCYLRTFLEIGRIAYLEKKEPVPRKNVQPKPIPPEPIFKPKIEKQLPTQAIQALTATRTPEEAIDIVKINAQHLPVKIHDDLNQDSCAMESNKHNLICHLKNLSELLSVTPFSPLATAEALQRENALVLESALSYLFAKFRVIDSEEKSLWQHNLDKMAEMLPMFKFSSDEILLLKSLSPMLSKASRLHLYPSSTRIAALLQMKNNSKDALIRASEETIQVLTLIQKIIEGEELPKMVLSTPDFPVKNVHPIHTKICSQLQRELEKTNRLSLMRVERMPPNWQALLREQQMTHMLKDLPYHFSMIDDIFNQAQNENTHLCPALLFANLYHLGHALEKCFKLSSLYLAIPSEINLNNHAAFDSINGRLRAYDHSLMRNLELLNQRGFELSKEEREAIDKLSDFSIFTRYPTGQKGALPELLEKATLLYQMRDGFFSTDLKKTAKKMFGGDQSEWEGKARNELMRIQTEEFLPLVKTLLKVGEKLLAFALEIRKSLPLTG